MTLEIKQIPDEDIEALFDLFNDRGLAENAGTVPYPIDIDWVRERLVSRRQGEVEGLMKDRGFYEAGKLVASGGYFFKESEPEIGYSVHRNERGRGLATRIAGLIIRMAREDRLTGPIIANYFTDNPASGRVLEKTGFKPNGLAVGTSMAREGNIESRRMEFRGDVVLVAPAESDYSMLFAQHQDKEAQWQAGGGRVFTTEEEFKTFHTEASKHGAIIKTVLFEGFVAGYMASFIRAGRLELSYWLGRDFWNKGIATLALKAWLDAEAVPAAGLYARAAKDHPASIRVLEKAGFIKIAEDWFHSEIRGAKVEEYIFQLPH